MSKKTKEDIIYAYTQQLKDSENGYVKFRTVNEDIRIDELVEKARKLQPELIVVDRDVPGKNQNYLTPENRIPEEPLHAPWESVLVTSNSGWSYAENVHYISGFQGIKLLVEIVAKGGNLLLNVPPSPEGELDQGVYDLLNSFGKWMEINKEGELILFLLALFRIRFILGLFLGAPFAR